MRRKRLFKRVILLLTLFLAVYLIITAVSIVQYGKVDERRSCDVAIVLGAGTANGEVSPVYRERINHGIRLYEEGYVSHLILTGGTGEGSTVSDAAAARAYAVSQGIPEDAIFIEEVSTITEENLEQAKLIMDKQGFKTALIVSDPLHMKRATLMARDYGIDGFSSPTETTMYKTWKTQLPFLVREEFFYIGYKVVRLFR